MVLLQGPDNEQNVGTVVIQVKYLGERLETEETEEETRERIERANLQVSTFQLITQILSFSSFQQILHIIPWTSIFDSSGYIVNVNFLTSFFLDTLVFKYFLFPFTRLSKRFVI